MKFGTQQQIWNSMTARWPNMNIFKIQNSAALKVFVGHNAAADCQISETLCVGKQFFNRISVMG